MAATTISPLVKNLVKSALIAIDTFFVSKIKNSIVQAHLHSLFNPIRQMVDALADGDPRDAEQVQAIAKKYLNVELSALAGEDLQAAIEKVKDPNVKAVLNALAPEFVGMLQDISDEDPDNAEQLSGRLKAIINSEAKQAILVENIFIPILEAKIKDESLRAFIIEIIRAALRGEG